MSVNRSAPPLEEDQFRDGLLWVGESYPSIDSFVEEAKSRGISRRVPAVPKWARSGKTRIFLAHRGNSPHAYQGKVFGYFVLERVEVLRGAGNAGEPAVADYDPVTGRAGVTRRAGREPEPKWIDLDLGHEVFSPERGCGLRLDSGAIYLVDALCAQIEDRFADVLRGNGLPERYKTARTDSQREELVLEGRRESEKLARQVSGGWPASKRAAQLGERAESRGELVLFKEPVTLVRQPRAAFRGLARINGGDLLAQIAQGAREVTVHLYAPPAPKEKILTKRQIAVRLAEREKTTPAAVEHLLDDLAALTADEIGQAHAFRLPGIGTLRPGPKRVGFKPAEALGR